MEQSCFKGLQLVCSSRITNKRKTTASLVMGKPIKREKVLTFDRPWEGNHSAYRTIIKDKDLYRMYYLGWYMFNDEKEIRVCYAESKDMVNWYRPNLGIKEWKGTKDNNIILDSTDMPRPYIDTFFCFIDENPKCAKEQKYKALVNSERGILRYFYSEDGVHFKDGGNLAVEGNFDTLNVCFYDKRIKKYVMYLRGLHDSPFDKDDHCYRDIRRSVSKDFSVWTKSERLNYIDNKNDFQLYTNNVMRYPGNEELYIGFPTRYVERTEWTDNYEKLPGRENRLNRMKTVPRFGLAITDCLFMVSEDGKNFHLYNEAFLTPGPETDKNWVYGDCYPVYPLFEENEFEYGFFMCQNHWMYTASEMFKYTIRKDGFVYYHAPFEEKQLSLKKKIYRGGKIFINFATSAMGYIKVSIEDGENKVESCEMFGDSIKREISISQEELNKFVGKKVIITIKMKEASVYSIIFD